jgi:hypothetical protein
MSTDYRGKQSSAATKLLSLFPEATPSISGEERFAFGQEAKPSRLNSHRLWKFRFF